MTVTRRIHPTRFGQVHVRSHEGRGVPLVLLHPSPRSGGMWEPLMARLARPTFAPDRLGYGFSDAPPWALSLEQYADSSLDALQAAGIERPFDLLGVHVGSVEAIEIAHRRPEAVRRVMAVGLPVLTPDEQQRQMEKYSEQPLRPAVEGGHVLAAWRGCFAFRQPPYDLADVHQRFIEHVLAANPGAAFRAACSQPIERKLKSLKVPLTVLAVHDDLLEPTRRAVPLLKPETTYIDVPEVGMDPFHTALERMATLIERHLPA